MAVTFEELIEEYDIPETRQFEAPPPPSRPSLPIESMDEDYTEDITIEETALDDFEAWEVPAPPENDSSSRIRFIPHDEPPVPIGGYAAIAKNLEYPPIALQAGIEGTIVLQAFVNEKGFVEEVVVLTGMPGTGLDEAAIRAVKKVRFKPAMQRDRPLGVWVAIPIDFQLTTAAQDL
ncbi:MAG: energy transducer TonB [Fidelibacterota bacterium]|nr:MAG: energy transducer TonB [Candidatus Neomarinimicrobiota bacterium]